jgi:hypothetical protein
LPVSFTTTIGFFNALTLNSSQELCNSIAVCLFHRLTLRDKQHTALVLLFSEILKKANPQTNNNLKPSPKEAFPLLSVQLASLLLGYIWIMVRVYRSA